MATATTTPKLSGRQSNASLGTLLEETARAFGKKLTDLEAEAHLEAWAKLERAVGRSRFESGLKLAIAESEYFPKLQQIASRVPDVKLVGKIDSACPACGGSGWERVFVGRTIGGHPVDARTGAVRRCCCWRKVEAA
jgi:hypothetical protein